MKNFAITYESRANIFIKIDCPYCGNSKLKIEKNNYIEIEDQNTVKKRQASTASDVDDFGSYDYSGIYVAIAKCENFSCQGRVVIICKTSLTPEQYYDEEGEINEDYISTCKVINIIPSPYIINIPKEIPNDYLNQIQVISQQYWINNDSCLNSIRILLEMIMNYHRVKKYNYKKGKKRTIIVLHNRIESFFRNDPKLKDITLALKWLGNEGSHPGKSTKTTVESSLKILEYILKKLYVPDEDIEVEKIAKRIMKKHK